MVCQVFHVKSFRVSYEMWFLYQQTCAIIMFSIKNRPHYWGRFEELHPNTSLEAPLRRQRHC